MRANRGLYLAALLVLAPLPGQIWRRAKPPSPAELEQKLASTKLEDLAWAGWLAAEHRVAAVAPSVRAALRRVAGQSTPEERRCALALLDSLVRIKAKVSPDKLVPFLRGDTLGAALLLLARDVPASLLVLGDLFDRLDAEGHTGPPWLAAGGLLLSSSVEGFAGRLLDRLELTVVAHVHDPGGSVPHRLASGVACALRQPDAAGPPLVVYDLYSGRWLFDEVVAGRPFPVSAHRSVVRSDRFHCAGTPLLTAHEVRAGWLAAMLGERRTEAALQARTEQSLDWRSIAAFQADIDRCRAEAEASWQALREQLVRRGLLLADDPRGATPRVHIEVDDLRTVREPPLVAGGK